MSTHHNGMASNNKAEIQVGGELKKKIKKVVRLINITTVVSDKYHLFLAIIFIVSEFRKMMSLLPIYITFSQVNTD